MIKINGVKLTLLIAWHLVQAIHLKAKMSDELDDAMNKLLGGGDDKPSTSAPTAPQTEEDFVDAALNAKIDISALLGDTPSPKKKPEPKQ